MSGYYNDGIYNSEVYNSALDEFTTGPSIPSEGANGYPCAARISDDLSFFANSRGFVYDWSQAQLVETAQPMPGEVSK